MIRLSYIIVTHNRRDVLAKTLRHLPTVTPLPEDQWEIWVVDNASTDGTADAVREQFPGVRLIQRSDNGGAGARSEAMAQSQAQYLILLDDDSYPIGDTVERSMDYLDRTPKCAAVVGRILLPDGKLEAAAFPAVMLSGAVCLRNSAIKKVGCFRPEFFRKAGEYDLSFRLWEAGCSVERFENVIYRHDKHMIGRSSELAHFMDLRNNLILVERYLPRDMRGAYRRDWLKRYAAIARADDGAQSVTKAVAEARQWARREAREGRQTLGAPALETLFQWNTQYERINEWAERHDLCDVVIADHAKNIYATWRGCYLVGLHVRAIADDNPAFASQHYRGAPILPYAQAFPQPPAMPGGFKPDGVVIANVNPAQMDRCAQRVREHFRGPLLTLWEPRNLTNAPRPIEVHQT